MFKKDIYIKNLIKYYNLLKAKKIDNLLIMVGILGVLVGLLFSVPIINQVFAWSILLGVFIKLYDFVEETEKNIIPYPMIVNRRV